MEIVIEASIWDRIAVILSGITLLFFAWILWYTRKQAVEAKRANDRFSKPLLALKSALPQYVFHDDGRIMESAADGGPLTLPSGLGSEATVSFAMIVHNYGQGLAMNVGVVAGWNNDRAELATELKEHSKPGNAVIGPGAEFPHVLRIPLDQYRPNRIDGSVPIFFGVVIVYSDSSGDYWVITAILGANLGNISVLEMSVPATFDIST